MGLFSGDKHSETNQTNQTQNQNQQGVAGTGIIGSGNTVVNTDLGAIEGALSVLKDSTRRTIDAVGKSQARAFNFGSDALGFADNASDRAFGFADNASDRAFGFVSDFGNQAFGFINDALKRTNEQNSAALSASLNLARDLARPDVSLAEQNQQTQKLIMVVVIVVIAAAVFGVKLQ